MLRYKVLGIIRYLFARDYAMVFWIYILARINGLVLQYFYNIPKECTSRLDLRNIRDHFDHFCFKKKPPQTFNPRNFILDIRNIISSTIVPRFDVEALIYCRSGDLSFMWQLYRINTDHSIYRYNFIIIV